MDNFEVGGVEVMVLTVERGEQFNAPIANAGADQSVGVNGNVFFDGSASTDNDGTIVAYEWTENNIVLATTATFSKNDFSAGTHTIQLKVTDSEGLTSIDTVVITIDESITTVDMQACPVVRISDDGNFVDSYPENDIEWVGANYLNVQEIEKAFNHARSIDNSVYQYLKMPSQAVWDAMNIQQQGLYIINSERQARGIKPYEGITENAVTVAQNYSDFIRQNNQVIGHYNDGKNPTTRLEEDLVIRDNSDFNRKPESIFAAFGSNPTATETEAVIRAIYVWTYIDKEPLSGAAWGHRDQILQTGLVENNADSFKEGLLGFGISKGSYDPTNTHPEYTGYVVVLNTFDPSSTWDNGSTQMVDTDIAQQCEDGYLDTDGDTSPDEIDAFPSDPTETVDTDSDGIGNNADTDDDDDGHSDEVEITAGTDPLDATSTPSDTNVGIEVSEFKTEFLLPTEFKRIETSDLVKFKVDMRLKNKPYADVKIKILSSDTEQGIIDAPSAFKNNELTFTPSNWDEVQTIIIISDEGKAIAGELDYVVQIQPTESQDSRYNGIDLDDIVIKDTTPKLNLSSPEQLDFVAGVYQWENIQLDYTGKEDIALTLENTPEGMVLENGRLSWTPSVAESGKSYHVTIKATDGALEEVVQFTINVATTSPIQKIVEGDALRFTDSDCNFSVPDFGEFKIIAKDLNTTELNNLTINKVTSEVDYHLPEQAERLSCFFTINPPPAKESFTGGYKLTLPVYMEQLPVGAPLDNVVLYVYNPFESTDSQQSGGEWSIVRGNAVPIENTEGGYTIEVDFPNQKGLYFIGINQVENTLSESQLNLTQQSPAFEARNRAKGQNDSLKNKPSYCQPKKKPFRRSDSTAILRADPFHYVCVKDDDIEIDLLDNIPVPFHANDVEDLFRKILKARISIKKLGMDIPKNVVIIFAKNLPGKPVGRVIIQYHNVIYMTAGFALNVFIQKTEYERWIFHELFHVVQYETILNQISITDVARIFKMSPRWVFEGQAKWFESVFNPYDPLVFRPPAQDVASILSTGLVGKKITRGRNEKSRVSIYSPYQRAHFFKMLRSQCTKFESQHLIKSTLLGLNDGNNGLNKLSTILTTEGGCDFGSPLGSGHSVASALLYFQYATQLEGKIQLLDKFEQFANSFSFTPAENFRLHTSPYIWDLELPIDKYLPDGVIARRLPAFGALTAHFKPNGLVTEVS